MTAPEELDAVDHAILDLLVENARRSASDIAQRVNLTPSPVIRRIERLERLGVITGYTATLDHGKLGAGLEAFAELRFAGNTKVEDITRTAADLPEVVEVLTVAGDPDALVRFRVTGVQHLADVVDRLRRDGNVIGTKTLMVLGSWRRTGH
ncbi:AsnC family transcriptional regulator [Nakamurella sp. YIM 132087]|uniref:AsnC family transcriptional regulator n=1 Tax=Nakamurella alba TaxID=2665158 RepID=A0A7K1FPR2_9ACTN|nr:Lrp/AsnC family transcriptional regulator [Nakamurella alba]MTD16138.1 AsnC family transcriptional regulator [Nakamurella alba]